MSKLTVKQEMFVQGVISGLSQREAYKQAGYSVQDKADEYIDVRASELMKNSKVLVRYNELLNEHKTKALWTREQAINDLMWLRERARNDIESQGVRQANSNAFFNAIKELNDLEDVNLTVQRTKTAIAKTEADTEFVRERTKLLKGAAKDTSLMEALIDAVKKE